MSDEFAEALGGRIVGRIVDSAWQCVCGQRFPFTSARDETEARLALYIHRQSCGGAAT